jgi:hypothetical protein
VDWHSFDADPDPNPDFDADQLADPTSSFTHIGKLGKIIFIELTTTQANYFLIFSSKAGTS